MKLPAPRTRPLDGITVVTLEHAIAAPYCTRQLADLGARVIKVERPGVGDFARAYDQRARGLASHFVWTNRSKESLTLDLKQPQALEVLAELLVGADVLVQNLAPGAAARMGLGYGALHAKHPRLIVCDISGYGQDGPMRDRKAYDLLIQSEAAFLSITGTPDTPSKAGISRGLFCAQVLRQPTLASDPRFATNAARTAQREALYALIVQAFASFPASEVLARLDAAAIANASVNTLGDLWGHPQLHARGRFRTIGSPAGELQALLPPAGSDAFEARMDPVPVGQGRVRGRPGRAVAARLGPWAALVALIETLAGLDAVDQLAQAPQVLRLAFGHLDFQLDPGMCCQPPELELVFARFQIVAASRRAALAAPLAGVTTATTDTERLQADAERARLRLRRQTLYPRRPDRGCARGLHAERGRDRLVAPCGRAVARTRRRHLQPGRPHGPPAGAARRRGGAAPGAALIAIADAALPPGR